MPPVSAAPPRIVRRPHKRRNLPRWVHRAGRIALVLTTAAAILQTWHSGRLESAVEVARAKAVALSIPLGYRVSQIEVSGRVHTDTEALLDKAGIGSGSPILAFSPEEARRRIESLPWVLTASVERRLPGTVAIALVERTPVALWQHNGRVTLIDAGGANLGPAEADVDLPLIVGGDAPAHAADLFAMLGRHPEIARRVQASSWIGSRRWTLKIDTGTEISLPETGAADALDRLAEAEASSRLLERDVSAIDLRIAGKMIVRLSRDLPAAPRAKPPQGI